MTIVQKSPAARKGKVQEPTHATLEINQLKATDFLQPKRDLRHTAKKVSSPSELLKV